MKYIFIDTNQYRHIFSKNEGFSDEIKNLLDKLIHQEHIKLLLPRQVKEEVERNRFENWYNDEIKDNDKKVEQINSQQQKIEDALIGYENESLKIKRKLTKQLKKLKLEAKNIKNRYRGLKSKANQKLKQLFDEAEYIDESADLIARARLRIDKNNPPNDTKLGDALIWESLIEFLKSAPKKSSLIFVARDGGAWGRDGFNPWLQQELKTKTKVTITLTKALADIKLFTKEEQESLRKIEREELKNNTLSNFINSGSFVSAGIYSDALKQYKDILTDDDYQKIVLASISNNQIFQSFFTSNSLNHLCEGENNFVVNALETIPKPVWDNFARLNQISLSRKNNVTSDIPF